jgi:hypothetical protein
VGPERPPPGEVEHLRPERGRDALVLRHRVRRRVEPFEEGAHLGQRALIFGGRLGVSDADAEQEAAGEVARELRALRGHVGGLVHPHVEDPGGDRDRTRALEVRPHLLQRRAAAHPQRAEAGGLDLGQALQPFLVTPPDPDRPKVHIPHPCMPVTPSG